MRAADHGHPECLRGYASHEMGSDSLLVPTLIAMAMVAIGWLGAARRFPYRHWAGLRTPATLSSPEAWRSAHLTAAPWMLAGGAGGRAVCAMLAQVEAGPLHGAATRIAMGVDGIFLVVATIIAQLTASRVRRRQAQAAADAGERPREDRQDENGEDGQTGR